MIRTAKLASGSTSTAGGTTTVYTVPTNQHVRLRRSVVQAVTASGLVLLFLEDPASITSTLITAATPTVGAPLFDLGDSVLEAGDKLRIFTAAGTGTRYWLSGTIYDN